MQRGTAHCGPLAATKWESRAAKSARMPSARQGSPAHGLNEAWHARARTRTCTHTRTRARTHARTLSLLQEELALLNSARPSVGFTFMRSMSECA